MHVIRWIEKMYLCDLSDKDNKNCVTFDERTDYDKNKHLLHLPHPDGNIYTCSTLYSYQNGKCVYNDIKKTIDLKNIQDVIQTIIMFKLN